MNNDSISTAAAPDNGLRADSITTWPGAFGVYKYSRDAVKRVWVGLLAVLLLSFVFSGISSYLSEKDDFPSLLVEIIMNLIGVYLTAALTLLLLAAVRAKKLTFGESLRQSAGYYWNYLLLNILLVIITVASFLLFIVPFFYVMPRLALAPYYLFDKNLNALDALKVSWNETKGHLGKVWGLIGATILMTLLIFVVVGIYFLFMYMASIVVLYIFVSKNQKAESVVEPVAPTAAPQSPVLQ